MLFLTATCLLLLATAGGSFQQSFASVDASKSLEKNVTILNFTTNTTKVENGKPFLTSCHISNFTDHANRNYNVRFYRSNRLDSRQCVATYKLTVKPSGVQSLIFDADTPYYYFSATPGAHFAYPTFEVVVTAKEVNDEADLRKNYWCELEVLPKMNATQPPEPLVVSNVWRIRKGPEYQVKLLLANHANLISDRYNELAVFHVPTLGPMMFLRNDSYLGRTAVSEGDNDALPLFDFVYRTWGSTKKDYFACRLEDPQSDWKQVTSDRVLHL
ncbi:hypothetical protein TYRP_014642 [Tyrophagus putrescentiae]|nr:hypothetical protein TYRP_014642 [Tyrophagus putrescentiae]